MRPRWDKGHAVASEDQKVALVVFIRRLHRPLGNWYGTCFLPTGYQWNNCVLLAPCYTALFFFGEFLLLPRLLQPTFLHVMCVTHNGFKGRKVLFVEVCSMCLWCFVFFEVLTKTKPPVLWEIREPICSLTLGMFQRSTCKDVFVYLVKFFFFFFFLSRLLIFFVWV